MDQADDAIFPLPDARRDENISFIGSRAGARVDHLRKLKAEKGRAGSLAGVPPSCFAKMPSRPSLFAHDGQHLVERLGRNAKQPTIRGTQVKD